MEILSVDPQTDPRWQNFLCWTRSGVFHSPPWLKVLTDTYGYKAQAFLVVNDQQTPTAGLVFFNVSDIFFGSRIVSIPFSDYCDPLVATEEEWDGVFKRLRGFNLPITFRCLDSRFPVADKRLTEIKKACWHGLNLDAELEDIWRRFSEGTRWGIRKAQRVGLAVENLPDETFLREFHQMHLRLRKTKYGLLAQPCAFFEGVCRHFRKVDGWYPMVVRYGDQTIAAAIFLRWKDTLYYKFSSSRRDTLHLQPNNFLIWMGIRLAKELGCRQLDFGLSDSDQAGLIEFKRRFGTEEKEIHYCHYTPSGFSEELEKERRVWLGQLTGLLSDPSVPDGISSQAATLLYRFLA